MPQEWDVTDPKTGRTIVMTSASQPTEAEIAAAFAAAPSSSGAADPRAGVLSRIEDQWKKDNAGIGGRIVSNLPTIAAMATAPFTAGLGPVMAPAVVGGASALGSLVRSAVDETPETAGEALGTAGMAGLVDGGLEGAGRLVRAAAPVTKQGARRMWQWATDSISDKTADAVLSRNAGTLTKRNLASLETPRGAGGTFAKREVSPTVIDTMRSGVDRASNRGGVPTSLTGIATAAFQPRPVSYAAQKLYNAPLEKIGQVSPQALRAAILALLSGDGSPDTMRPLASH